LSFFLLSLLSLLLLSSRFSFFALLFYLSLSSSSSFSLSLSFCPPLASCILFYTFFAFFSPPPSVLLPLSSSLSLSLFLSLFLSLSLSLFLSLSHPPGEKVNYISEEEKDLPLLR